MRWHCLPGLLILASTVKISKALPYEQKTQNLVPTFQYGLCPEPEDVMKAPEVRWNGILCKFVSEDSPSSDTTF